MVSLLRREVVNLARRGVVSLARRGVVSLIRRQVVNLTVFCNQRMDLCFYDYSKSQQGKHCQKVCQDISLSHNQ